MRVWHRRPKARADGTAPDLPKALIRYTCGHDDVAEYERSGREVASMLTLASLQYFGRPLDAFPRVLDFGCGAGRLQTHLRPESMTGCDVNPLVIEYCREAFPDRSFVKNDFEPPLPFDDGTFDAIISFSVFSHLERAIEDAWLEELRRVGAPGCVYLLSVQGDWMIEQTLGEEKGLASDMGFYYRRVHQRHGSLLDFPDGYESLPHICLRSAGLGRVLLDHRRYKGR